MNVDFYRTFYRNRELDTTRRFLVFLYIKEDAAELYIKWW
jgi:hypothetical protein